jgi:hypothetical protein
VPVRTPRAVAGKDEAPVEQQQPTEGPRECHWDAHPVTVGDTRGPEEDFHIRHPVRYGSYRFGGDCGTETYGTVRDSGRTFPLCGHFRDMCGHFRD